MIQKDQFKRQQNPLVIWLVIKSSRELQNNEPSNETEILNERYISLEKRQQITDELRLV